MYQVIEIYGDFEPWWFLDDWQEDIISEKKFDTFEEALAFYKERWEDYKKRYPSFQSRGDFLAAFWDSNEKRWCDDCDEDLQQFHSLLLLKDFKELPETFHDETFHIGNQLAAPPSCSVKL